MKLPSIRIALLIMLFFEHALAADNVPFTVKRIKPVGAGYVELIGPGEIKIDKKVLSFEDVKYIKKSNIGTITSVDGAGKGCVLAYSSEGYTESIVVQNQSCNEILSILSVVK